MGWNRSKETSAQKEMFDGVRLHTSAAIITNMVIEGHPEEAIASVLGVPVEELVEIWEAGKAFEELRAKNGI